MLARSLALLLLVTASAHAEVTSFEVGSFGKRQLHAISGGWYPIFVSFEYSGPAGDARIVATNAHQGSTWEMPLKLSGQTRRQVTLYCYQRNRPGQDQLRVALIVGDKPQASRTLPIQMLVRRQQRILLLGHPNLQRFCDARLLPGSPAVIHHPADQPLPGRMEGYDPFQLIVACRYPLADLPPAGQAALRRWVEAGGELIFSPDSAEAGQLPPWLEELLPVRDLRPRTADLSPIRPLIQRRPSHGGSMRCTGARLSDSGRLLAAAADGTVLLAAGAVGLGQVIYCGYDLSRPPLIDWAERHLLLQRITNPPVTLEPTPPLIQPLRRYFRRAPSGAFLAWVTVYLACYLLTLALGGLYLARRAPRTRRLVLFLPGVILTYSVAAPILSRSLLHLRTDWQSLTLRFQRAGAKSAAEWTYFKAYPPGAVTTRIQFEEPELACYPPVRPDHEDRFGERSIQGDDPALEVRLLLSGKHTLQLARRVRRVQPLGGKLLVEPVRAGLHKVTGQLGGGIDKHADVVLLMGETAGRVTWERRAGGVARLRTVLDSTPRDQLRRLLRKHGIRIRSNGGGPYPFSLPLPPERGFAAHLVFIERTTEPMQPKRAWRSFRHLRLWVLQLPLELPTSQDGARQTLPVGLVRGTVTRSVEAGDKPLRFRLIEKRFELPPAARSAREVRLNFDLHTSLEKVTRRWAGIRVAFEVLNQRTGLWEARRPLQRMANGRDYIGPRGEVLTRLALVTHKGVPVPPPPAGAKEDGPGFRLRELRVGVELVR